ncbi:hypothetical protein [Staphylococcus hyicus]|nr:hypothetical protein [Staphylococcus hyicus]
MGIGADTDTIASLISQMMDMTWGGMRFRKHRLTVHVTMTR